MAFILISLSKKTQAEGATRRHPVSSPMGRYHVATVPKELDLQSITLLEELKPDNNHMNELGRGALPIRPLDDTAAS